MFDKGYDFDNQEYEALKDIGQLMPGGFFIYRNDKSREILYVNEALCRIFGCGSEEEFRELTGFTVGGMILPEDAASVEEQYSAVPLPDCVEFRIIRKDSDIRWVELYGYRNGTDGKLCCAFLADVTEKLRKQELEKLKAMHEKLHEEQNRSLQMDRMITALASDYRSVYHIDLDSDDGVCYRADPSDKEQTKEGIHFPYVELFTWYAEHYVDEAYREDFLRFIDPENIRKGLARKTILAYRYLVHRCGVDTMR